MISDESFNKRMLNEKIISSNFFEETESKMMENFQNFLDQLKSTSELADNIDLKDLTN